MHELETTLSSPRIADEQKHENHILCKRLSIYFGQIMNKTLCLLFGFIDTLFYTFLGLSRQKEALRLANGKVNSI